MRTRARKANSLGTGTATCQKRCDVSEKVHAPACATLPGCPWLAGDAVGLGWPACAVHSPTLVLVHTSAQDNGRDERARLCRDPSL